MKQGKRRFALRKLKRFKDVRWIVLLRLVWHLLSAVENINSDCWLNIAVLCLINYAPLIIRIMLTYLIIFE